MGYIILAGNFQPREEVVPYSKPVVVYPELHEIPCEETQDEFYRITVLGSEPDMFISVPE